MVTIKRFLDIGAQSILIPYVQNADEAKNAVAYTRYPPRGRCAASPAGRGERFARVKDYANAPPTRSCACSFRSRPSRPWTNLGENRGVEGVDGVIHRPGRSARSLGYPARRTIPRSCHLDDALRRIRERGKAPGNLTGVEADARHWIECGACSSRSAPTPACSRGETEKARAKKLSPDNANYFS